MGKPAGPARRRAWERLPLARRQGWGGPRGIGEERDGSAPSLGRLELLEGSGLREGVPLRVKMEKGCGVSLTRI